MVEVIGRILTAAERVVGTVLLAPVSLLAEVTAILADDPEVEDE